MLTVEAYSVYKYTFIHIEYSRYSNKAAVHQKALRWKKEMLEKITQPKLHSLNRLFILCYILLAHSCCAVCWLHSTAWNSLIICWMIDITDAQTKSENKAHLRLLLLKTTSDSVTKASRGPFCISKSTLLRLEINSVLWVMQPLSSKLSVSCRDDIPI